MSTSTKIGCDSLVYTVMSTEDTVTTPAVYGTIVPAPGLMSIKINPNSSQETLFADDGPMDTASTIGKIDVEIMKNQLSTVDRAALLGHSIDAAGSLLYSDSDVPPFVAIGFRSLKSNGKYRYVWLYKGKFTVPEDTNETKGDSINFQAETIKGQFLRVNNVVVIDGKKRRLYKYELDEDSPDADQTVMDTWFEEVKQPKLPAPASAANRAEVKGA